MAAAASGATSSEDARIKACLERTESTKNALAEDLDALLERGGKIDKLVLRSDALVGQARTFEKNGAKLKDNLRWQSLAIPCGIVFVAGLIAIIAFNSMHIQDKLGGASTGTLNLVCGIAVLVPVCARAYLRSSPTRADKISYVSFAVQFLALFIFTCCMFSGSISSVATSAPVIAITLAAIFLTLIPQLLLKDSKVEPSKKAAEPPSTTKTN